MIPKTTFWGSVSIVFGAFGTLLVGLAAAIPGSKYQGYLVLVGGFFTGLATISNGQGNRQSKTGDTSS